MRSFLSCIVLFAVASAGYTQRPSTPGREEQAIVRVGSRRELFIDRFLIDRLTGASLALERPHDEGVVLRFDKPWEGRFCGYATVIKDGPVYRLYYRGLDDATISSKHEVTCYAESKDGIHWTKPELGLFEVNGSKANNIVLAGPSPYSHNFCPTLDPRKDIPKAERYKALAGTGRGGLVPFVSAGGPRWKNLPRTPVITPGAFDSANRPGLSEA